MNLIFKIALRNILLHKGKSLVVGAILFIGSLVMTLGNATLSGMDHGIQRGLVDGLMGDLMIMSKRQKNDAIFTTSMGASAEVFTDFDKLKSFLSKDADVAAFMPFNKGTMMILVEMESPIGQPPFTVPFGIDFQAYQKMFDNIELYAGRFPRPGERGILIHKERRDLLYQTYGVLFNPVDDPYNTNHLIANAVSNIRQITPQTNIILMGTSDRNSTLDIRVPVLGVYHNRKIDIYPSELLDLESFREAMNYSTAADKDVTLTASESSLLKMDENPDALFSGNLTSQVQTTSAPSVESLFTARDRKPKVVDVDLGSYELVSVRLKNSRTALKVAERLNADFTKNGIDARAVHWKKAAGAIGSFVAIFKGALFVFTFLIFFVAIIIIMNTLAMTTLERVPEFGMMRAVGAQKGFLSLMLLGETFVLSMTFGGLGILIGGLVTAVLASLGLSTDNRLFQLFLGGPTYHPVLLPADVVVGLFELGLVTLLAVLYPVYLARKIQPLDAISRD